MSLYVGNPVEGSCLGTLGSEAQVLGLDGGEGGQLGLDVGQVQLGNLLVQDLGEDVDADLELAGLAKLDVLVGPGLVLVLVQGNLGKDLVGEGAGHDEGRVAGSAAKVDQTTLSQEDDVAAVGHGEPVDLGLDVLDRLGVGLEPSNVDLNVKVANNVTATGGGDEDLANGGGLLHGGDLVAGHGSLEGVDGVDLGDDDPGAHAVESHGAALADIAEAGNDSDLAGNHDIGGTLDSVNQRLAAAVQVVKLGLGDAVVDVDGRDQQLALLEHAVQVVDAGGGLLGDAVAVLELLGVLCVHQGGQVAAVVEDQVQLLAVLEGNELLLEAPVVLLLGLALPGEDGDAGGGNGGRGVVLGAEDVAAGPGDLGAESHQGLDEDGSLDGHVQAAGNAGAAERLVGGILVADGHQTGHLVLSELNLPAAKGGQGEVGDLELIRFE
ncbi:hypothetical protein Trco_007804 [Trichoderma cornu-damae]|uniref:Uncharacterized protein n=1 Tax=Trichoderma cornu-damae TaxID=654480 RepID=A0A9P8TTJ8_9HYPO|nr:hypothetical protein Trco_007804 [Trichoderma cornu-damae]